MYTYPEEALREALINAVVHRDYSPYMLGSHVRIEMFVDRLEVMTPGGLFGPVTEANLESAQSTRNQQIMRILNEIGLVEDRGSGVGAMLNSLREAHLEPPRFHDTRTYFTVVFSNQSLLDPETVAWLSRYASLPLNPRQRTALAYLYRHQRITNPDYCRLNNVDSLAATRELRGIVDAGVIAMHGTRRWAFYTLRLGQPTKPQSDAPNQEIGLEINLRQKAALDYLKQSGSITVEKYIQVNGGLLAARTARADLQALDGFGLIKKVGKGRATYYVLTNPK